MTVHRMLSVERLPDDWQKCHYDLAIAAAGYEARSRHVFEVSGVDAELKVAAAFPEQQVFEFNSNIEIFRTLGFSVEVVTDEDYPVWCASIIERARGSCSSPLHLIADISSLSRVRLAHLVSSIRDSRASLDIMVDFIYSLASFTSPVQQKSPNSHVGPVTREFAGWWTDPDRLLSVVVGLGYEQDKALGAVEYLQADDVWTFIPDSVVEEYTPELLRANESLLRLTRSSQQFVYHVSDALDCFSRLQSLVQGLETRSNVVLLPFGPKLFVLCCLLLAATDEQIAVWRVSANTADEAINRTASGNRYGLRALFTARQINE